MQMIYCTCNVNVLTELIDLVEKCNVHDYQVIDRVIAKNRKGAPRFNTSVWPGFNATLLMQVKEEDKVKSILEQVKEKNAGSMNEDELITVCTWHLDDYIFE
ncbi:MAG: hypothetical protein Q8867_05085 [Bacteroidota bacterium]|nr:hypothetical protein [Bacteroidota bacterium]